MSAELHTDIEPRDARRPNVAGDLPTIFRTGPMFRRTVAGYDRYQVDTYVQWAEDELATSDREHEDLVARHVRTRAALEEARHLLSRSSGGAEMLRLSQRIGSMLAAAADDAEGIRAEAEACRSAAAAQAEHLLARTERLLDDAAEEAARMVALAAIEVEERTAAADRLVDEAERTGRDARTAAQAHLDEARAIERRASQDADRIRQRAVDEASTARLQVRQEIVRMLDTSREERRAADAAAAATRERLEQESAARRGAAVAEVKVLRRRRSSLRSEIRSLERRRAELLADADSPARRPYRRPGLRLRPLLDGFGWRLPSVRTR